MVAEFKSTREKCRGTVLSSWLFMWTAETPDTSRAGGGGGGEESVPGEEGEQPQERRACSADVTASAL